MKHGTWPPDLFFHRAGVHADDGVQRAEFEQARDQRHNADPTPDADGAHQAQGDQNDAHNNAQNAIDTADVEFHGPLLEKRISQFDTDSCGRTVTSVTRVLPRHLPGGHLAQHGGLQNVDLLARQPHPPGRFEALEQARDDLPRRAQPVSQLLMGALQTRPLAQQGLRQTLIQAMKGQRIDQGSQVGHARSKLAENEPAKGRSALQPMSEQFRTDHPQRPLGLHFRKGREHLTRKQAGRRHQADFTRRQAIHLQLPPGGRHAKHARLARQHQREPAAVRAGREKLRSARHLHDGRPASPFRLQLSGGHRGHRGIKLLQFAQGLHGIESKDQNNAVRGYVSRETKPDQAAAPGKPA